jgi:hypothetical protein
VQWQAWLAFLSRGCGLSAKQVTELLESVERSWSPAPFASNAVPKLGLVRRIETAVARLPASLEIS